MIVTGGRTDLDDFWRLSGVLNDGAQPHAPFLVFLQDGATVHVVVIRSLAALVSLYPDETPVMRQWPGKYRSDYFQFTVGQARLAYEQKVAAQVAQEMAVHSASSGVHGDVA